MTARACFEYGIAICKKAFAERSVSRESALQALESPELFSEDEQILFVGPSFGPEVCDERVLRHTLLGLRYFDDFFDLRLDHPHWIEFAAQLSKPIADSR